MLFRLLMTQYVINMSSCEFGARHDVTKRVCTVPSSKLIIANYFEYQKSIQVDFKNPETEVSFPTRQIIDVLAIFAHQYDGYMGLLCCHLLSVQRHNNILLCGTSQDDPISCGIRLTFKESTI